jgi:hypothetical protein
MGACGGSESETSDDRDRNSPISEAQNLEFGVNGNGVAVNPLWVKEDSFVAEKRTITLADNMTVYATLVVATGPMLAESSRFNDYKFQIARVDTSIGRYSFDKTYGLKTMKLTQPPTYVDRFIPTQKGYAIHVINPTFDGAKEPSLVRYRLDDRLIDTAFGSKGTLRLPSLGAMFAPENSVVVDVADDADGKILVLVVNDKSRFLMRMNTKGVLDQSFGTNGIVSLPTMYGDYKIDALSRILVSKVDNQPRISLVGTVVTYDEIAIPVNTFVIDLRLSDSGLVDGEYTNSVLEAMSLRAVGPNALIASAIVDISSTTGRQLSGLGYRSGSMPLRVTVLSSEFAEGRWLDFTRSMGISSESTGRAAVFYEPTRLEDRTSAFGPDEKSVGELIQFTTLGYLYGIGVVDNRASNFTGLAIGRDGRDSLGRSFDLADVLRVMDYQSSDTEASKIRTAADGSIRFSVTGLGQFNQLVGVQLDPDDIGLVQSTWGVAMTENGGPIEAFGGGNVWAKNPVTADFLSAYFVTDDVNQLGKSMTLVGDDNALYVIQRESQTDFTQIRKVSVANSSVEETIQLTSEKWWWIDFPPNPDAMEIRDGYLYVAANFTRVDTSAYVAGVGRYSLSTGAMDTSYGLDGVVPVTPPGYIPLNRILHLQGDGSFHLSVQVVTESNRRFLVWQSPESLPAIDSLHEFSVQPKLVTVTDDVYSDVYTQVGPIGHAVDSSGRVLVSRIRSIYDPGNGLNEFTMRVWRYLASGQLDESFGDGGRIESDVFGWAQVAPELSEPPQISVTANDKILVGFFGNQMIGQAGQRLDVRGVHVMARLMPNGEMDALKAPQPTPIPVAQPIPGAPSAPVANIAVGRGPSLPNSAAAAVVPVVESLDPKPVVMASPVTSASSAPDTPAGGNPMASPGQLKIIAMTSAVDRSIGVKWAIPQTLANKTVTYEVAATPGGKACTTASTLCVFRGLDPWTTYTFTVGVKSGAEGVLASDPSSPLRPMRILARKKTVKTTSLVTPAAKGKLTWRVTGGCTLSADSTTLSTPKDATTCTLSVRSPKAGKTPAATRTITIDVRAIVK